MDAKQLGIKGEEAAASYLENKNYKILERNWKCCVGEVDIIALFQDTIIFVEVKTRRNIQKGLPEDAVGAKKRRKYECIAAMYLQDHDYINMSVRFDVVGVLVVKNGKALVRHHINAFGVS